MSNFARFENAAELESLQQAISFISPDLKLTDFTLDCSAPTALPRVKAVTLKVPEKGNKLIISNLMNIGFRKLRRESEMLAPWDPFSSSRFIIILKKTLVR